MSTDDANFVLDCELRTLRQGPASHEHASTDSQTSAAFMETRMESLMTARREKAGPGAAARDFVMCTSHDLAPLLVEACAFPKDYFKTKVFKQAYKRWEKDIQKAARKGGNIGR